MNVSDLDGSDNEKGGGMNDGVGSRDGNNQTEVSENLSGDAEVTPNNDAKLKDVENISKPSEVSEKDLDTWVMDSNTGEDLAGNTVDCASTEQMEPVEDVSKYSKENHERQNEQGAMQVQTKKTEFLNKRTNEKDSVNCKGNDQKWEQNMVDEDNKSSSMEISNCDQGRVSTQLNSDSLQRDTEKMAEQDSCTLPCTERSNQVSTTMSSGCKMESEDQHFQHGSKQMKPSDEIPSSIKEFMEEIVNLALNLSLDNADERQGEHVSSRSSADFTSTCTENPSGENSPQDERGGSLKNGSRTFPPTESVPQGNFETICVSSDEKMSTETLKKADEVERKSNEIVAGLVEEGQGCAPTEQETNSVENERPCSDSAMGSGKEETTKLSVESEDECETDSEDEYENDHRSGGILTLQPAYQASPGECSVMSCLSQFCASELLDGNNKFACEVCTRRAQRAKKRKGSRTPKDDDKDDVSGDSSSEG